MTKKAKLDRTISDDNMTISTKDRNENESEEERTLRKQLRRAKKMARHLEKLGLDENGEELDNFSLSKYPVRESTFTISGMNDRVAVNPVVTLMAIIVLWSIVVWCTGKFIEIGNMQHSHDDLTIILFDLLSMP